MTLKENHPIEAIRVDTAWLIIGRTASTFRPIVKHQALLTNDITDRLIHLTFATKTAPASNYHYGMAYHIGQF